MAYTSIDDPAQYFNTVLYTGDGGSNRSVTVDFQPNFVWIKERNGTNDNTLFDSVRGATKRLRSNAAEAEDTQANQLKSFDSDGFTLGSLSAVNNNGQNYVSWNWKEDATAGFDIVSYTGNSSDGTTVQDISHSLSAVPHWIIVKNKADSTNWAVYHKGNTSAPETEIIYLNATNATSDDSAFFGDTAPTSSQFRVGGDNGVNGNGDGMIAYVWSEKKGFSKFGKYSANNDADGPFVYLGFRPAWLMLKVIDGNPGGWDLYDNKRGAFNGQISMLQANASSAQATSDAVDFLSNGFKIRNTSGNQNGSGDTIIYMAFAESPFVNSNGVPCNAR